MTGRSTPQRVANAETMSVEKPQMSFGFKPFLERPKGPPDPAEFKGHTPWQWGALEDWLHLNRGEDGEGLSGKTVYEITRELNRKDPHDGRRVLHMKVKVQSVKEAGDSTQTKVKAVPE